MNTDRIYDAWKRQKQTVDTSAGFTETVMDQVQRYEQQKRPSSPRVHQFLVRIYSHTLTKAALVAICALLGVLRLVVVAVAVLN